MILDVRLTTWMLMPFCTGPKHAEAVAQFIVKYPPFQNPYLSVLLLSVLIKLHYQKHRIKILSAPPDQPEVTFSPLYLLFHQRMLVFCSLLSECKQVQCCDGCLMCTTESKIFGTSVSERKNISPKFPSF